MADNTVLGDTSILKETPGEKLAHGIDPKLEPTFEGTADTSEESMFQGIIDKYGESDARHRIEKAIEFLNRYGDSQIRQELNGPLGNSVEMVDAIFELANDPDLGKDLTAELVAAGRPQLNVSVPKNIEERRHRERILDSLRHRIFKAKNDFIARHGPLTIVGD